MKIAMVSPIVGDAFGQEKVMRQSTELLRNAGHKVYFIGERQKGPLPQCEGSILIPKLNAFSWTTPTSQIRPTLQTTLDYLQAISPDVVHFIDQFDHRILKAISEEYPSVLTSHTVATSCPSSTRLSSNGSGCNAISGWECLLRNKKQRCLSSFKSDLHRIHAIQNYRSRIQVLKQFPKIIAISQYIKNTLLSEGWKENKVELIYNPIEIPSKSTRVLDTPENLILCASRFTRHKGIDVLINALSKITHHRWECWICGEGDEADTLSHLVTTRGLNNRIQFLSHQSYQNVQALMSQATMLIQPNTGPEPFGLSAAESSALGTPVIASNLPALNEIIVPNKNGLLFEPGNVTELSEKISLLLSNESLRKELSSEGPALMKERFSEQLHLTKTVKLYENLF